jgi:hypothetical protein
MHSRVRAANGGAPFYMYWIDGKENLKQRVMFSKMWQTDSIASPGASSSKRLKPTSLRGAYDWVFTDVTNVNGAKTTEATFTITGTPKVAGDATSPKPKIKFTNHLLSSANGTELKYDVDITEYADDWWDSAAQGLVMAYKIETVDAKMAPKNRSLDGVSVLFLMYACMYVCT